mmetsp:Transcript_38195/g.63404  ORF Transcript_38195/g.63404 Transcript_38195/m.63404 type:complete len:85 (+) Transcript_38195:130-384(+)
MYSSWGLADDIAAQGIACLEPPAKITACIGVCVSTRQRVDQQDLNPMYCSINDPDHPWLATATACHTTGFSYLLVSMLQFASAG